ncbi:MAG: hypothetical protein U5O39_00420 [Gammaproteobacteria bacterium]|nr:hypothetical protein [Gammaproteobacteria bacterium]
MIVSVYRIRVDGRTLTIDMKQLAQSEYVDDEDIDGLGSDWSR